jgi:hypothetical protein
MVYRGIVAFTSFFCRMNPNNSDQVGDDITGFGGGLPMQGFYGGWNPGLQPYAQQYPYFQGGWTAALNQGFMPLPNPPSSPAAPAQNQPVAATVESVEPVVLKESQGDGEGASLPAGRRRKVVPSRTKLSNFSPKEDVFLVKSWLEISCDPIINTGQKKDGFWARITSQYNNRRGSTLREVSDRCRVAGTLSRLKRINLQGTWQMFFETIRAG